jgi:hypothetical protein
VLNRLYISPTLLQRSNATPRVNLSERTYVDLLWRHGDWYDRGAFYSNHQINTYASDDTERATLHPCGGTYCDGNEVVEEGREGRSAKNIFIS